LDAKERSNDLSAWSEISTLEMPILIIWGRENRLIDVSRSKQFTSELNTKQLIIYDSKERQFFDCNLGHTLGHYFFIIKIVI